MPPTTALNTMSPHPHLHQRRFLNTWPQNALHRLSVRAEILFRLPAQPAVQLSIIERVLQAHTLATLAHSLFLPL